MRDFGLEVLGFDGKMGGKGLTRMSFGERKMGGSDNMEARTGSEAQGKVRKRFVMRLVSSNTSKAGTNSDSSEHGTF